MHKARNQPPERAWLKPKQYSSVEDVNLHFSTMYSRRRYNVTVKSFEKHGSEFVIGRNNGAGRLAKLLVIVWLNVYVYIQTVGSHFENVFTATVFLSGIFLLYAFSEIHTESLLVLSSIGVTFKQTSMLSTKSTFFDISSIRDIVILEAISKQSVIFQLVLLPTKKASCDKHIYPLFKSFQPCLEDLKTVYHHVQEKMIIPNKGALN